MKQMNFIKMVASGNDFVIIEKSHQSPVFSLQSLARKICDRKYGIGADGFLVLEKSKIADISMRIFNPDGSEAQMCGNGVRCIALWAKLKIKNKKSKNLKIKTKAGIINSEVNGDNTKIKLTNPKDIKLDIPIKINNRALKVNFINSGVPHAVIFVEGLDKIDVSGIGGKVRYHKRFAPYGTNVDFVEVLDNKSIKIRTYERGVEDETLACGTGVVASALITIRKLKTTSQKKMYVHTKSGEILKVYFDKLDNKFKDVWLEGRARMVYKGEYYV
jgi:diaminopimelate epimerase